MEYLGEFLSPQNNISLDQDQIIKYFYFRPGNYDDPEADIENIIALKQEEEFPKRYDPLTEMPEYQVDTISVSKRVTDEEPGVKQVSYIVTATYDLSGNIKKREETGSSSGGSSSPSEEPSTGGTSFIDEDGNKIVGEIFPWKQRATWSTQPIELTVPFIKAYNYVQDDVWGEQNVDVLNSAKSRILAETRKYQLEITYTKNYEEPQTWDTLLTPYLNADDFDLDFDFRGSFNPKQLLLLPPSCNRQYGEFTKYDSDGNPEVDNDGNTIKEIKPYYTYTVRMIFDPDGHDKTLLDVGTYAIFGSETKPSQIWEVSVVSADGVVENNGQSRYTSATEALKIQSQGLAAGKTVYAAPVSEPLPLNQDGTIFLSAITDPVNNPYRTLTYTPYAGINFADLPFKN